MGKSKRKNISPLMKEAAKTRRVGDNDEDDVEVLEEDSTPRPGTGEAMMEDLKKFIRAENQDSRRCIMEDLKRCTEERIAALETSLSFALTVNETLSKRLTAVEKRTEQAEQDFVHCARRICTLESELDDMQQSKLMDWLIFSGPAVPRRPRNGRENTPQLLSSMLEQLMEFHVDMDQIREVHREDRQIRVRFATSGPGSDRDILFRNKTRLRGTGLYIRENLTKQRLAIFNELSLLKRERKIATVLTRGGTVFVVVSQGERPRPVHGEEALRRLISSIERDGAASQSAGSQQRGGEPTSPTGQSQGDQRRQAAGSASPASRELGMPTPVSSASRDDGNRRADHQAAGRAAQDGGAGDGQSVRSPGSAQGRTAVATATTASPMQQDRSADHNEAEEDQSATPVRAPAVQQRDSSGHEPETERRPAPARTDERRGGEPTANLRRRLGADIRRYMGAPRGHSKCD